MSSLGVFGQVKIDFNARVVASNNFRFSRIKSTMATLGGGASASKSGLMAPAETTASTFSSRPLGDFLFR